MAAKESQASEQLASAGGRQPAGLLDEPGAGAEAPVPEVVPDGTPRMGAAPARGLTRRARATPPRWEARAETAPRVKSAGPPAGAVASLLTPPREKIVPAHSRTGPVPVLFIAGSARSGSTLLDRLIGMHESFCSVGELHFIWERSFGANQLCGCNSPFHECEFWREVSQRAFGVDAEKVDAAAITQLRDAVERKRYLPWLLLPRRPAHHRLALEAYGERLERLYRAILRVSRSSVIVDSSKDPRHGLVLSLLPGFELHVVHLIRDPRAVAHSWGRVRRRPEIHWASQDMDTQPVRAVAARWTTHNMVVELLARSASSYRRVRYEDFVADPRATLSRILPGSEWRSDEPLGGEGTEVTLEPTHTVAGNPMRFKNGRLPIAIDDEWRETMPVRDRWQIAAMTWPLLKRYGYGLRPGAIGG